MTTKPHRVNTAHAETRRSVLRRLVDLLRANDHIAVIDRDDGRTVLHNTTVWELANLIADDDVLAERFVADLHAANERKVAKVVARGWREQSTVDGVA